MGTAERPTGRGDLRAAGTVAFVGCGRMGAPMARRLLAAGARVAAYDVDEHALAAVAEAGARAAASPRDAADGAAFAVTMLPDPAVVERAACGPDGLLAGLDDRRAVARDVELAPGDDEGAGRGGRRAGRRAARRAGQRRRHRGRRGDA